VNQPLDYVNQVATVARLSVVQLHGDESVEFARQVDRPVLKALSALEDEAVDQWPSHVTILADAHDPERRGGTGGRADWSRAAAVASRRRLVLAGGLTPANAAEAVARVRPFGIDVSSGVESAPGVKDHEALAELFRVVQQL
jgi:phosphoribosylanthranilate isomerase